MPQYQLSPSSLTFLPEECPRCFYNEVHKVYSRPRSHFPGVFRKIDGVMRNCYCSQDISKFIPGLSSGFIDTTRRRLKSAPIQIPGTSSTVILSGEVDAVVRYNDGTLGIVDFKTSDPKTDHVNLYSRQLHAYADIFQFPEKGLGQQIGPMGLICVSPVRMTHEDAAATALMEMELSWKPIAHDREAWLAWLQKILAILDGMEEATEKPKCQYCAMQRAVAANLVSV